MARKTLIQVIGLQRSGNHAIINWLSSLFERAAHHNELVHDYFRRPETVAAVSAMPEDCLVFSFEDSVGKLRGSDGLVANVALVDPAAFPDRNCHVIYILRDPYNCWASRVKARETGRLTSSSALADFERDWIGLARLCRREPDRFVLYNRWFQSQAYRKRISARVGGEYSEKTLGEVLGEGGGSSFDGFVRPSYATILRKFDHYLTSDFRQRFLKSPRAYLARLVSPAQDGRQLRVDSRWEYVVGREDAQALFANEEIRALSRELFGFYVDGSGQMIAEGGAKGLEGTVS